VVPVAPAIEADEAGWLLDLIELLGLQAFTSVGFVTGATVANFVCLAAARSEVLRPVGWDVEADGLFGAPPIPVLIGEDARATVYSGLKYLGLGASRVRALTRIGPLARRLGDAPVGHVGDDDGGCRHDNRRGDPGLERRYGLILLRKFPYRPSLEMSLRTSKYSGRLHAWHSLATNAP
jgi:hypothetical protein